MKYGDGATPVPNGNQFSDAMRQKIVDGLKDRLATEQARIDERKDNFYNTLLPLVDSTSKADTIARRVAYNQNTETKNVFHQWQQYQQKLKALQYQQKQKIEDAMAQYSSTGMRAQREKAGTEAGAVFDSEITELKGFMATSFEQYSTNQIKSDLANESRMSARFENISAYNNAISEGFSLASAQMDLGDLQRQIGFFEGRA